MQRSSARRRDNKGGGDASVASSTSSSISSKSTNTTSSRSQQRKRGSFANPTSSSLSHGGPNSSAPPAGIASSSSTTTARFLASLPTAKTTTTNNNIGEGIKENLLNMTPTKSKPSLSSINTSNNEEVSPPQILSPTPYWKVLEERSQSQSGKKTSPRTTRSATKKKLAAQLEESANDGGGGGLNGGLNNNNGLNGGLGSNNRRGLFDKGIQELNELQSEEEEESNSDSSPPKGVVMVGGIATQSHHGASGYAQGSGANSLGSDGSNSGGSTKREGGIQLHFSPPDKQFHQQSIRNAKRRHDATIEKERLRLEKAREVATSRNSLGNNSLSGLGGAGLGNGGGSRRTSKRVKRTHSKDAKLPPVQPQGPTTEEMRTIMAQSLEQHNSSRIEELITKCASSERDTLHYKSRYEELLVKYNLLEDELKKNKKMEDKGSKSVESELQIKCIEQIGIIQGLEGKINILENDKKDSGERYKVELEKLHADKQNVEDSMAQLKEEHTKELHQVKDSASKLLTQTIENKDQRYDTLKEELNNTQTKLTEVLSTKEDELQTTFTTLNDEIKVQKDVNTEQQGTITALESNVADHAATITNLNDTISQLEDKLVSIEDELSSTKRTMEGMSSPNSRNALEEGYSREVKELKGQLHEMKEAKQVLESELETTKAQKEDLQSQLDSQVEQANVLSANLKSANVDLTNQVESINVKYQENERQLEEMAMENEQLTTKLGMLEDDMKQQVQDGKIRDEELQTTLKSVTAERDTLNQELSQAQADITSVQDELIKVQDELATSKSLSLTLQADKSKSDSKLTELSSQLQTLTNHLESAQLTISSLESKLQSKSNYCEQFEVIERQLIQEKFVLNEIRRDLHNRVIQLSGNIRVFVRVRPMIESERLLQQPQQQRYNYSSNRPSSRGSMAGGSRPSSRGSMSASSSRSLTQSSQGGGEVECPFHFPSITDRKTSSPSSLGGDSKSSPNYTSFNDLTKQTIELTEPYKDRGGLNPRRKKWKYGFDRVFNPENGQEDVWEGAEPLVQSCVDGKHVCMFAYGQTSSGKVNA